MAGVETQAPAITGAQNWRGGTEPHLTLKFLKRLGIPDRISSVRRQAKQAGVGILGLP